ALGAQDRGLALALGREHRRLLGAFRGQDLRLLLAFRGEDQRAAIALGAHLLLHRGLDVGRRVDRLDLHAVDADAPLSRRLVEHGAQLGVDVLARSEEHTSELQSPYDLVCRLLLEKKKKTYTQ